MQVTPTTTPPLTHFDGRVRSSPLVLVVARLARLCEFGLFPEELSLLTTKYAMRAYWNVFDKQRWDVRFDDGSRTFSERETGLCASHIVAAKQQATACAATTTAMADEDPADEKKNEERSRGRTLVACSWPLLFGKESDRSRAPLRVRVEVLGKGHRYNMFGLVSQLVGDSQCEGFEMHALGDERLGEVQYWCNARGQLARSEGGEYDFLDYAPSVGGWSEEESWLELEIRLAEGVVRFTTSDGRSREVHVREEGHEFHLALLAFQRKERLPTYRITISQGEKEKEMESSSSSVSASSLASASVSTSTPV